MNIAIIGGGLTGLTAAYELLKHGHQVTVFESEKTLGGLAGSLKMPHWNWSLEYFYHHFFTNDKALISLANELGLEKDMLVLRPVTATLIRNKSEIQRLRDSETQKIPILRKSDSLSVPSAIFQLDSPLNLLTFPLLSPIDKIRTAALLGFCKINPFWKPLETITAEQLFKTIGGKHAWELLWEPLMAGKFGTYAKDVPASWLWARFYKRTMQLEYFQGGFQTFIDRLAEAIIQHGGKIVTNSDVASINHDIRNKKYEVRIMQKNHSYIVNHKSYFDKILITTPSSTAVKLLSSLHHSYIRNDLLFVDEEEQLATYTQRLLSIPHLWAQTLILETNKPILDKTYWLNVTDRSFPFIAVVAHTNMIDKKYYGGNHITYIGNYLPDHHPFLTMTKQQLLKKFLPYLKKINPSFIYKPRTMNYELFTLPSAQPVHTLNYSQKAPAIKTPIDGIYLANLDSIYPWDRGTNYAVELGQKAAIMMEGEI